MSEKRFVIGDDNIAMFEVIDIKKEELVCECRAVDVETLVDLLNSFAEENEELQEQNKKLEQECKQHLATNLRLLEQLEEVEKKN